jgi:ABC-2 type transport system permease protein
LRVLRFILQKEFRQILRDKTMLPIIFLMPIIQLLLLPLAADFDIKNINLVVVDNDHSSYSRQLTEKIFSSGYFRFAGYKSTYSDALALVENGKADIVLEIPASFESALIREGRQQLLVAADAINGTKAGLGSAYLQATVAAYNQELLLRWYPAAQQPAGVEVLSAYWFNPHFKYTYYMVPGILVMLITIVGGFLSALNIVREKELGTIEQINVTPIQKWQFVLGKMIPFLVIGLVVFSIGLLVGLVVYGIVPEGNVLVLYLFATIYLIALLNVGLLISNKNSNQVQAMFVAFFFIMIFILMSGLFTPLDSMPGWAKVISYCTPITHFIQVTRMVILKGSGLVDLLPQLGILCAFAVALNAWAIWSYSKTS